MPSVCTITTPPIYTTSEVTHCHFFKTILSHLLNVHVIRFTGCCRFVALYIYYEKQKKKIGAISSPRRRRVVQTHIKCEKDYYTQVFYECILYAVYRYIL